MKIFQGLKDAIGRRQLEKVYRDLCKETYTEPLFDGLSSRGAYVGSSCDVSETLPIALMRTPVEGGG